MSAARKTDSSGSSVSSDADSDSSTPDDGIHKCDTVPPPDGESDAYNAPTKIGPMADGYVEQLMALAEVMTGKESAPPKSGERPLAARKPLPSDPPVLLIPPPATIPRVWDANDDGDSGDQLDPTSLFGQQQSGETKLLEVDLAKVMEGMAPPPPSPTTTTSAAPAARVSAAPAVASQSMAAQLAAYRASVAPTGGSSDAKLVFVTCLLVTLGLAALYFFFLAA